MEDLLLKIVDESMEKLEVELEDYYYREVNEGHYMIIKDVPVDKRVPLVRHLTEKLQTTKGIGINVWVEIDNRDYTNKLEVPSVFL